MVAQALSSYFLKPNDPLLLQTAKPVPVEAITSSEIKNDIKTMFKIALGEQQDKQKPLLVGLAAPQIGISKRIIFVDRLANGTNKVGDLNVYINPEIIWHSEEENEWYEACYSTDTVCGVVSRPTKIKVRAFTSEGSIIEEEHSGYTARIFQHEIDHLNGIEFVTHIIDDTKLHLVEDDEFPIYRNNEGWRTWKRLCPREEWNKIKGIKS
jgi:peptide deformylase